jgi:hypothetical protein
MSGGGIPEIQGDRWGSFNGVQYRQGAQRACSGSNLCLRNADGAAAVKTVLALVFLTFAGAAGAADSPAQVAYCVESLRELLAMNSATTKPDGVTPQWEMDAFRKMQQEQDAKIRPVFDQWRLLSVSLLSQSDPPMLEMLRGQHQAQADWALINSRVNASSEECKQAPEFLACFTEKQKVIEADPTVSGARDRNAPCMRGPSL